MSKYKITALIDIPRIRIIFLLFATLVFLFPVIQNGTNDREEYLNTIISSLLNAKSLHAGHFLLWSDNLGFGTPMPIGHDNTFNPIFWFWPLIPFPYLMGFFWLFFASLSAIYFARLLKIFSISGIAFYTASISYIFSMPFLTLVYRNDWPTLFFNWAMFSVWFYYAIQLIEKHSITKPFLATIRLGLILGLCLVNAHFGYLSILFTSSGIVIFLMSLRTPKVLGYFTVAAVIAAIIGAANMSYVISEIPNFPNEVERFAESGYTFKQIISAFLQPLSLNWLLHPVLPNSVREIWDGFLSANTNVRVLAFGAPFMMAAIIASALSFYHRRWKEICFSIGFVFAFIMSLLSPDDLYRIPSGTWLFRDIAVFLGIVLAAVFLQDIKRALPKLLIAIPQISIVVILAIPSMYYSYVGKSYYYQNTTSPSPIIMDLLENAKGNGTRIYFAPHIEKYLERGHNRTLNDPMELSLYGLSPINGWFKGVSQDIFYPSASLMHGFIKGNKITIENQELLDLLGIELIVADDNDLPKNQNIKIIWSKQLDDKNRIHLLKNETAWKQAWMMSKEANGLEIKPFDGCNKSGFLCADVRELVKTKLEDKVTTSGNNGKTEATFTKSGMDRLLVFSKLYRKDWLATSEDRNLKVLPLANSLLAVEIPAGVSKVSLEYKPQPRYTLRIISFTCFIACLALIFINTVRFRKKIWINQ